MCGDEESQSLFGNQRCFALYWGVGLQATGDIAGFAGVKSSRSCRIHFVFRNFSAEDLR